VSGIGPIKRPEITKAPQYGWHALTDIRHREVCFDAEAGYVETPVFDRSDLVSGSRLSGPAIIEEFGSTVPVHPGFEVRVDDYLNLIVTREDR